MLQLASVDANNMAALGFDELLQCWGRGAIRKRFLELSMLVHPDKCNLPQADLASAALHTSSPNALVMSTAPIQAPSVSWSIYLVGRMHVFKAEWAG